MLLVVVLSCVVVSGLLSVVCVFVGLFACPFVRLLVRSFVLVRWFDCLSVCLPLSSVLFVVVSCWLWLLLLMLL